MSVQNGSVCNVLLSFYYSRFLKEIINVPSLLYSSLAPDILQNVSKDQKKELHYLVVQPIIFSCCIQVEVWIIMQSTLYSENRLAEYRGGGCLYFKMSFFALLVILVMKAGSKLYMPSRQAGHSQKKTEFGI